MEDAPTLMETIGQALYGKYWKSPLARALDIPNTTLDAWIRLPIEEQRIKLGKKVNELLKENIRKNHQALKFLQDKL